jgi:hypothetical protein
MPLASSFSQKKKKKKVKEASSIAESFSDFFSCCSRKKAQVRISMCFLLGVSSSIETLSLESSGYIYIDR